MVDPMTDWLSRRAQLSRYWIRGKSRILPQALIRGPQSIDFDNSFFTIQGVQNRPHSFFRNGCLTTHFSDAVWWKATSYNMASDTCR